MVVDSYYRERKKFYDKYPEFFSDLPELEYALYGSLVLEKDKIEEIKYASEKLWEVLKKVKTHALSLGHDELVELGYPSELVPYFYLDYLSFDTVLSRFDFIVKDDIVKAIEINNVTPFLVMETFLMNNEIVENENSKIGNSFYENQKLEYQKIDISKSENPKIKNLVSANENCENEIKYSYTRGIVDCCHFLNIKIPKIAIVSQGLYEDWEENAQVSYIHSIIPSYMGDIEFFNIKDLAITIGEGAYTPSGDKIDILIMPAYPHEFLMKDMNENGEMVGIELLNLVRDKKLALLNPPSANILQSKISFAILWGMYEKGELTQEEEEVVLNYLAPTYDTPLSFILEGQDYVKKSSIGREGSSVEIVRNGISTTSQFDLYGDYNTVCQEFIELPKQEVIIGREIVEKHYIIGSFICNDKAVGLSCRLGAEITEWDSHWLSVAHLEENKTEKGELQ